VGEHNEPISRQPSALPAAPRHQSRTAQEKNATHLRRALGGERSPRAWLGGLPARGPHHVDGRKFNFFLGQSSAIRAMVRQRAPPRISAPLCVGPIVGGGERAGGWAGWVLPPWARSVRLVPGRKNGVEGCALVREVRLLSLAIADARYYKYLGGPCGVIGVDSGRLGV